MSGRRPRIVINALSARAGGGITYLRNMLRHLSLERGVDVTVVTAPDLVDTLPSEGPFDVVVSRFAGHNIVFRMLWERLGAPRLLSRLGADVYYVLSGTLVGRMPPGCQSVVGFRNMLPFAPKYRRLYPHGYMRYRLWLLQFTQGRSFARADAVIFISRYGREVIEQAVGPGHGRSLLIPHGVSDAFFGDDAPPTPDPRWPDGYVLYVSVLDVYKAQLEVVEAWAELRKRRETPEKLVLAGAEYGDYGTRVRARIAELGLEDEVVLLGPVPHDELPGLYRNATLHVYASRCENCPNILLEALASGRPILCSSDPPMPEFGGDAVEYFDPEKPEQLTELLLRVLDDDARLAELAAAASERARSHRIADAMDRTWETLLELTEAPRS